MNKQRPVEEEQKAPAYIVVFTTLIALLLAFFVVLVSMGQVRDDTLLDEGEGGGWSFLESFQSGFSGGKNLGSGRPGYFYGIKDPEEDADGRTVDARSERVRRFLKEAASHGTTIPSPIDAERVNFVLTDIRFSGDDVKLNEQAKHFMSQFCAGLLHDQSPDAVKLCVLCVGGKAQSRNGQLALAATRAKAVEDSLRAMLPATGKWSIYSWAAGPESPWTADNKLASTQSQVLIAVLRNGS